MAKKEHYEEQVRKQPGVLVKQIITELQKAKAVDIHFEDEDAESWAIIKVHFYEEDMEMGIRLHSGDKWVLDFGFYDDDDEFIELLQPLTQPEIDLVPMALQKVMRKVLATEEGLRIPGNVIK